MARTKKTAAILRALNMQDDASSDSDDSISSGEGKSSSGERILSEDDEFPNAQDTGKGGVSDGDVEPRAERDEDGQEADSAEESAEGDVDSDADSSSWLVQIDGIGEFTHRQLMAMEFIWSLSNACDGGMQCYSWLMSKIDSKFEGEGAASLADRVISSWPFELLPGFGAGFDLAWCNVYCARSECWYNDNFIHAFTITLADTFKNNSTIFLPPLSTPAESKGDRVSTAVVNLLANTTENLVFMPMNINKNHWTCIVVDRVHTTVTCYDSVDKRANHKLLAEVAAELVTKSLPHRFKITAVHSPLQKDNDNCGLFVCLYFWRRVFKEAGNDYTEWGLSRR